ncbi:MAG TPA: acyl-CoA thioesterase, partial [Bacteroidetes bacterium]|nr:acyl-CoA thioesterase [Bacteroidota bacterium]
HVNNAVFLNYLEYGRVKSLELTGKSFWEYARQGIYIVIARIDISYLQPAYMGDQLEVSTEILRVGRSSVVLRQSIFNRSRDEQTASAEVTAVFLGRDKKPIPVPEEFLQQMGWTKKKD